MTNGREVKSAGRRMRMLRQRRQRGVVAVVQVEVLAADIPILVRRGLLPSGKFPDRAALEDAVASALEQWVEAPTPEAKSTTQSQEAIHAPEPA